MENLDNYYMNNEAEIFNSSSVNYLNGFMHTSGNIFSDHHHQHQNQHQVSHPLSFMSMQDGTYNLISDPLSSPVYDRMSHFPTPEETFGLQHDGATSRAGNFMSLDPPMFSPGFFGDSKGHGGKKRKKNNESGVDRLRDVVHVRAKRGEATDSHSLAERLRREKINEKLRRLQDLVPGCYKTMGMSVMLDVIINYVQSLQNQIEFLSMKLSAASMFYDYNSSEVVDVGTLKGTNGHEAAQKMMVGEGYGDFPRFQPIWSP
ncbi:hypothetical protein QVD17_33018 [Tagetes erecta]|uniref:BHLH domain-containing protein n=1 Tax=Tagetes erecta TaxID=13708 RepID=A0AAD8K0G1_TARER|nr:hypothetical protein QVD17_33018 [Tagetes erecta]